MTDTPAEDIVVEVAPETAPPASGADAAPAAPPSDDPQVGVEELRRQLADKDARLSAEKERADREAAARAEAERRAQTFSGEAQRESGARQQAEYDSIVNALGAAEKEADQLKAEATAALEAGEFAKANEIQLKLGRLGARMERLEEGKQAFEARRKDGGDAPRQETPPDPREAYIASKTPATAAWLRAHPEFFSDKTYQSRVVGAHGYVTGVLGIAADTPEYFRKVEEIAAGTPQERKDAVTAPPTPAAPTPPPATSAAAVATPRAPTPAAPPTPTVPSSRPGVSGNRVTLTPEEAAHARATLTRDIIGDQDPLVVFARHKAALQAEGKYFGPGGQR